MHIVVAMMKHETNTFSPVPTLLERFQPIYGEAAVSAYDKANICMGGFIQSARDAGAEITCPIAASALPSGVVDAKAYEHMCGAILDAVAKGCDALFLDLHGAMVSETTDDGEGTLLERVRAISADLPIAVALDLHTNLTETMVDNATALVGYRTYPHIDMRETGVRAANIVLGALNGDVRPIMAWGNRPMLPATLCMGTDDQPMRDLIKQGRLMEENGLLAATVFGGFPLADIEGAGLSVVLVADGRSPDAECKELLDAAWEQRERFVYKSPTLSQSVARAKSLEDGPILLIDHADNAASGGTQDTMALVEEVIRQGLEGVGVFGIVDPEAVGQMIDAGVGAQVTLPIGGKIDMPQIGLKGRPLEMTGTVRAITDGQFVVRGPMYTGTTAVMGRSVVLDTGPMQIVVIERNHEPWDLGCFQSLGIDPMSKKYLILKSRIHYRAGFSPIARHVVECAGTGVTGSDNEQFSFRKIRRPIYPLDIDGRVMTS